MRVEDDLERIGAADALDDVQVLGQLGVCRAVAAAEAAGKALDELTLEELKSVDGRINESVMKMLSVEASVSSRQSYGGTAPERVREAIATARAQIAAREK